MLVSWQYITQPHTQKTYFGRKKMRLGEAKRKARKNIEISDRLNLIIKIITLIACILFWILKIYWVAMFFTIFVIIDIINFIRFWKFIGEGWGDDKD
jgi:hypothetical protein